MEHWFDRKFYDCYNNAVLPIVFYLTLPPFYNQHDSIRNSQNIIRTRSKKKQQRDQDRLDTFRERKTVCSLFPFSSVDDDEFREMMKRPILVHIQCSENCKTKLEELQVENDLWGLNYGDLKDNFEISQTNLKLAQNRISKLNDMLREEQANIRTLQKKLDTENYLCKEKLQEKVELLDKEKEQKKYLEDQHRQEVYKLKNEISCLKIELENYKAKPPPTESYLGTHKPKKKQSQAHKKGNLHVDTSSSNEKKESTTAVMSHQSPGCFKCGSKSPHTASQCPAKNFRCDFCSRKGHHSYSCMSRCGVCGDFKLDHAHSDFSDRCFLRFHNCDYCHVMGHLSCVCLQKRFDELGY